MVQRFGKVEISELCHCVDDPIKMRTICPSLHTKKESTTSFAADSVCDIWGWQQQCDSQKSQRRWWPWEINFSISWQLLYCKYEAKCGVFWGVRKGHMVYLMAISNGINAPTKLHVLLCFLQRSMICCNHTKEGQRHRKGGSLCAFRKERRSELIIVLCFWK